SDPIGAAVLVQQSLAVVTCLAVWLASRRIVVPGAAAIAGVVVALAPNRHYYAQTILTESLAEWLLAIGVCLLLVAMDQPQRRLVTLRALAGAAFGAATLVRPNLAPAMCLASVYPVGRSGDRTGVRRFAAGCLATTLVWAAVLTPWLAFNAHRGFIG